MNALYAFLKNVARALFERLKKFEPLIHVYVSKSAILHNLHAYQAAYPKLSFAPVLKSNAYGHGLVPVARILAKERVPFFALDSLYEARTVRAYGIRTPLLIIGYTTAENIVFSKLKDVAFTITSLEQLRFVGIHAKKPVHVHIKVDTGMHRQGLMPQEISESISLVRAYHFIRVEGICSHYSDADNRDPSYTKTQSATWHDVVEMYRTALPDITYFHIAASAGVAYADDIPGNVARIGLGLYGINPSPTTELTLQPALELKTIISSVRVLSEGAQIGYNGTYTLTKPATIATIPVGYYEGVDRRLSSNGYVCVKGVLCPIVGRVSMNITSIDVSRVPSCAIGDAVTVFSGVRTDEHSIASVARRCCTIPWEILVHIPAHIRRTVID